MTTEEKALAMVKAVRAERQHPFYAPIINRRVNTDEALCRIIEQHEAFRQEVSDAVSKAIRFCKDGRPASAAGAIGAFVIPAPKPDPLVDVAKMMGYFNTAANAWAGDVRAALEARGLEIREKNDD